MPAYSLLNGSIGWRADGGAEIRLWAKNLTNENYFQYRIEQSLVGDGQVQAPPRTYGVTLSTAFCLIFREGRSIVSKPKLELFVVICRYGAASEIAPYYDDRQSTRLKPSHSCDTTITA